MPTCDGVYLAGHQGGHIRTDRDNGDQFLVNLVLGQQGFEQNNAGRLNADFFADHVLCSTDRVFLEREKRVGVLLQSGRKHLDGQVLRNRQHV